MKEPLLIRIRNWACEYLLGHYLKKEDAWYFNRKMHNSCKICGRHISKDSEVK